MTDHIMENPQSDGTVERLRVKQEKAYGIAHGFLFTFHALSGSWAGKDVCFALWNSDVRRWERCKRQAWDEAQAWLEKEFNL